VKIGIILLQVIILVIRFGQFSGGNKIRNLNAGGGKTDDSDINEQEQAIEGKGAKEQRGRCISICYCFEFLCQDSHASRPMKVDLKMW